jgi:hypothetical protein
MSSKYSSPYPEADQSALAFEEELGELIRQAEAEEIDLLRACDVEASEEGCKYMIEISCVRDS